jgi:hypothetical protein
VSAVKDQINRAGSKSFMSGVNQGKAISTGVDAQGNPVTRQRLDDAVSFLITNYPGVTQAQAVKALISSPIYQADLQSELATLSPARRAAALRAIQNAAPVSF